MGLQHSLLASHLQQTYKSSLDLAMTKGKLDQVEVTFCSWTEVGRKAFIILIWKGRISGFLLLLTPPPLLTNKTTDRHRSRSRSRSRSRHYTLTLSRIAA